MSSLFNTAEPSDSDSPRYLAYLSEAESAHELLAKLADTGCVRVGKDNDGHPLILLIPHLGLPRVYLEGENEANMIQKCEAQD